MITTIFTKSLGDRWLSMVVAMTIVGAFLVLGMAAYQEIDLSIYTDMPEAMRSIMGVPADADPAALAYGVIYGLVAGMTLGGLAVSMGASGVAGEERDGTVGLLLGNPRSRRQLLVAKMGAMVGLVGLGALIALALGFLARVLLGVEVGGADVVALVLHLLGNALFFGFLATAIGASSGNRALASAVPAGLMVLSFFLVGILPLIDAVAPLAKALPWYWFDGHDPVNNGIAVGYLALQLGLAVVFGIAAWVGVEGRDLRKPMGTTSLLDRLREHPVTKQVFDRLAGSSRVSSVFAKSASQNQPMLLITAFTMFSMMGLLMGPMYAAIADTLATASASLPEALLAFVGGGDMSTPEGWYQLETMGLMAPIAVILVAATAGATALAGEEQRRTMGLLLASPVSRSRVVLEKAGAMTIHAVVVGLATFLGITGGSLLGGLGMSIPNIAAACLLATQLGLLFGALALVLSAATGKVKVATLGTVAAAGSAYALNAVFSIAESLDRYAQFSPFHWAQGNLPLVNGMDWGAGALLLGSTIGLLALAVVLFDRRDLRRS